VRNFCHFRFHIFADQPCKNRIVVCLFVLIIPALQLKGRALRVCTLFLLLIVHLHNGCMVIRNVIRFEDAVFCLLRLPCTCCQSENRRASPGVCVHSEGWIYVRLQTFVKSPPFVADFQQEFIARAYPIPIRHSHHRQNVQRARRTASFKSAHPFPPHLFYWHPWYSHDRISLSSTSTIYWFSSEYLTHIGNIRGIGRVLGGLPTFAHIYARHSI